MTTEAGYFSSSAPAFSALAGGKKILTAKAQRAQRIMILF
jgi:hypothetical protein